MANVTEIDPGAVESARSGCPDAWNTLFHRYQLPLYAFVFEFLREEQPSLDAVQETFIKATRWIHQLRSNARFGSWLFGIAHQICIQHVRKRRPVEPLPEGDELELQLEPDPAAATAHEELERQEETADMMDHLQELPEDHRAVLVLHYLEEFSIEAIAEIVNAPVGTVKSRLHHARIGLRKKCLAGKESAT